MINRTKTLIVASVFAAGIAAMSGSAFAERGFSTDRNANFYALEQDTDYYAQESSGSRFAPRGQRATKNDIETRYPPAVNQSPGGYNN